MDLFLACPGLCRSFPANGPIRKQSSQNRRFFSLFAVLVFALSISAAQAQEDPAAQAKRLTAKVNELHEQGKYSEATSLAQQVVDLRRRTVGTSHADYASSVSQLAELYVKLGRYADAEPLVKTSLQIREKALGSGHPDVAESLDNLAQLYLQQGNYSEAEPLCKRALAIREKALGPEHPDVAESLSSLASVYNAQGKFAEAEALSKRSLEIREKAFGPDHPTVAESLNSLGELAYAQSKYADAEVLFKRSLAIREKKLGPNHPEVAESLNNLAGLYDKLGKYAEAESLFQRSLEIWQASLGPDHPYVATCLNNLGALYDKQGRYAEAQPLYKRALAIDEKALGPDNPGLTADLSNLAGSYSAQGRYDEAESLYDRSLAILEKALQPDHPDVATALSTLAGLYFDLGKYAQAEKLCKRALAIREKAFGPDNSDVATSLNNLAELYYAQGKYAEAEPLYQRSLAIWEKAEGPEHPDVATNLNNLAELYHDVGKYAQAESLHKRSLAIREKALGPAHPDVATSLNNLASIYVELGRYSDAEQLYLRAQTIFEKALRPDHPLVAATLNNLAALYRDQARYADAEPLYKRCLTIREKQLGPEHPEVAITLDGLAELYKRQGRYADAEPLYKRSLAIWEKAFGPDHPDVSAGLNNFAGLYYAQGLPAQASPLYDRSFVVLAKQFDYHFTYMTQKERLAFLHTVSGRLPAYFSFCLSYHEQLPELAGKMYDMVLWEKGFIAQSAAALRAKIQASRDADALKLLDLLTEKKNEIAKLASTPLSPDAQKQAARHSQIEQLDKEANDIEKSLVARFSVLGEEKRLAHATWQQVRDALQPSDAAVEIVRFRFFDGKQQTDRSYYVALVLRHESQQPAFVVLGQQKDLEGAPLADYRDLIAAPDSEPGKKRPPGLGSKFCAAFWQPLQAPQRGAARVYISTDAELNQVSLSAVPQANGRLLMEAYDLRIVNSTKDLLRTQLPSSANTAVLVGNPKFDLSEAEQRSSLQSAQPAKTKPEATQIAAALSAPAQTSFRSRDLRSGALNELAGTQLEVEDVSSVLKRQGWRVQTYTGPQALEERVKAVHQPRVLHLATHGFFEPDQWQSTAKVDLRGVAEASNEEDPMLRSGLYLAGANRILKGGAALPDLDDGVLTAYEATQLNLQGTELVVLSACETGLGKNEAGEGVFGLRRALQEAGAQSVLMSMWSVPDEETRELMKLFYEKWLGGKEKHDALREAQQQLRAEVRVREGHDEPFFWAAFVLVGR